MITRSALHQSSIGCTLCLNSASQTIFVVCKRNLLSFMAGNPEDDAKDRNINDFLAVRKALHPLFRHLYQSFIR